MAAPMPSLHAALLIPQEGEGLCGAERAREWGFLLEALTPCTEDHDAPVALW
jgi:hypothetical protein